MSDKAKSYLFDFIQFGSIFFFFYSGSIVGSNFIFKLIQLASVLIGFLGIWEMRRVKFYRVPDVGKQKELVTGGIYQLIRNPMYLAQLLFFGILILDDFNFFRTFVYLLYLLNFVFKISYEEKLLDRNFKEFKQYRKSSFRLIPFVY